MKKKILAALVMLLAIVPAVVVKAAASYSALDYINFLGTEADKSAYEAGDYSVGFGTFYMGTSEYKDADNHAYLKVVSGSTYGTTGGLTDGPQGNYKTSELFTKYVTSLTGEIESPFAYTADNKVVVDLITLDEAVALFGATEGTANANGKTYSIELNDAKKRLLNYLTAKDTKTVSYVYTSSKGTAGATNDRYYAIKVTKDANGGITSASIEAIDDIGAEGAATGTMYYGAFVLYMNEGYTCKEDTEYNYACYSCPADNNTTEYVWKVTGTQDAKCTVVKTVGSKDKCVKNAKTGVESYLVPAAIVLGVCAIVLTVVKRKDAFRAI